MLSKPYMILLVIISTVITLTGTEFAGLLVFIGISAFTLFVCDETIASTLPFMLICCFMLKCFDSFGTYIKIVWLAPICAAAVILHFVIYRKPIKSGSTIWSLIGITISVTLGGLGSISAKEYFSLTSIYYVLGLGIGMLIVYLVAYSYFDSEKIDIHRTFAYIMYLVCIFACLMVILHYVVNINKVIETRSILEPQWRNNISTIIMLTMPFAFYLSIKQPHCFAAALITMPCLVLTSSRGGLLFGGVEYVLCCIYILYADKAHRKRNLLIFSACGLALIMYAGDIITFISKTISRFDATTINSDPRTAFIRRAVEDFKNCPVFGRGIGYMGNRDIYASRQFAANWYHSAPFQVIGSFGLVGIAAFTYQFYRRTQIFWTRITYFTLAVYISYIGIFLMSLVNPGEFCPIPYELALVMMFAIIEKKCPANTEKVLIGSKSKSGDETI